MDAAQVAGNELFDEYSAQDADFKAIFAEWDAFRQGVQAWNRVNEFTYADYIYSGMD